jgi:hypothetical protein
MTHLIPVTHFIIELENEADRKRVTHLACCILPKANRDTMEVLFVFMKWVSQFAQLENNTGSKMDIVNLATVLAPNILYSKSKDPAMDESFYAIETVTMLLENAEEFATVPEDFIPLLQNLSYEEGDMDMNVRHILKKCEMVMKMKRVKATGGPIAPQLPRQHSSPAAVSSNSIHQEGDSTHMPIQLSSSPQNMSNMEPHVRSPNTPVPIMRSQSSSHIVGTNYE